MPQWRRYLLAVVLWIYGLSISVTLVSVWGRALVVDTQLMASSAVAAADSEFVSGRIESWLVGELSSLPGVGPAAATGAATAVAADPALAGTIDELVARTVIAAAAPVGEPTVVDVAEVLSPAVPAITKSLADQGISASEEQVEAVVADLDPLVVRDPEEPPVVGSGSDAASTLSLATLVGVLILGGMGSLAIWLSEDRRAMLRGLFTRIAVSALGFAVMFRLGSWILDPGAGRSPARTAASQLAGAKLWIPVLISVAAAVAARFVRVKRAKRVEAA